MSKEKITIASPRGILIPAEVLKLEKDYQARPHEPVEVPLAYGLSLIENRFADEVEPIVREKAKASSASRSTGRQKGTATATAAASAPDQSDPSAEALLGSNILPAQVEIATGKTVQLGDIVAKAHEKSGLSIKDWNAQADDTREAALAAVVEELKAAADQKQP